MKKRIGEREKDRQTDRGREREKGRGSFVHVRVWTSDAEVIRCFAAAIGQTVDRRTYVGDRCMWTKIFI